MSKMACIAAIVLLLLFLMVSWSVSLVIRSIVGG